MNLTERMGWGMEIVLVQEPGTYDVEVQFLYDGLGDADDETVVEEVSEVVARAQLPPPPPVPLTRRERDRLARLRWVLDDLGLGALADEIMRRLEEPK
jgi:hypothetical protein